MRSRPKLSSRSWTPTTSVRFTSGPARPSETTIHGWSQWTRLLAGLVVVFALFQWSAVALGSYRGEAGLIVGVLVVTATVAAERLLFHVPGSEVGRVLGLGTPASIGTLMAIAIGGLLIFSVELFARVTGGSVAVSPDAASLAPGLFAQAGVAEEILFRGYLFAHLRRGRAFWQAASLSMIPFVAVHLALFFTMPWPIALGAMILAVALSFPFAHLFELGGGTIWPPAILHCVIQGTVKVVSISKSDNDAFPLYWILISGTVPMLALLVRRRPVRGT